MGVRDSCVEIQRALPSEPSKSTDWKADGQRVGLRLEEDGVSSQLVAQQQSYILDGRWWGGAEQSYCLEL